jgi:hypothetical protein
VQTNYKVDLCITIYLFFESPQKEGLLEYTKVGSLLSCIIKRLKQAVVLSFFEQGFSYRKLLKLAVVPA